MRIAAPRRPGPCPQRAHRSTLSCPASALAAHTIAAARAAGTADRVGSLEPGKLADLAVLDRDPGAAAPEQLDGIAVTQTWVGGTLRYPAAMMGV